METKRTGATWTAARALALLACGLLTGCGTAGASIGEGEVPEVDGKPIEIASLEIHPVLLAGRAHQNVAEALGLILEQKGFMGVLIGEDAYLPPAGGSWEEAAAAFAARVKDQPMEAEYALLGEFQADPERGFFGVRGAIADRKGRIIWKEALSKADQAFRRMKPDCPMTCCALLADRLDPMLVKTPGAEGDGPMARLWAERSGLPDEQERKAMDERRGALKEAKRPVGLAVFPVRIGGEVDAGAAKELAALLNESGFFHAEAAGEGPWFDIPPSSNEQRLLWDMARAFRSFLKERTAGERPPEYALYADYLMDPERKQVGGVHFAVCNPAGEWVIVDFQNSHQPDFQRIDPDSVEDCNELVKVRMDEIL